MYYVLETEYNPEELKLYAFKEKETAERYIGIEEDNKKELFTLKQLIDEAEEREDLDLLLEKVLPLMEPIRSLILNLNIEYQEFKAGNTTAENMNNYARTLDSLGIDLIFDKEKGYGLP